MSLKRTEVMALNEELMSFDIENVNAEELERRLELAIATMPTPSFFCEVDCSKCTTNCCCSNTKTECPPVES
jgi:hypothetical protein